MAKGSKFLFDLDVEKNGSEAKAKDKKNEYIDVVDLPVLSSKKADKFKDDAFNNDIFKDVGNTNKISDEIGLKDLDDERTVEEKLKDAYQEISDQDEPEVFEAPVPEIIAPEVIEEEKEPEKEEIKEEPVVEEELPPPPVTFSEDELNEAKKISYQEGYEKARADFETSMEKDLVETMKKVAEAFESVSGSENEAISQIKKGSIDVALAVCKKVLPTLETKYSFIEVSKTINDVIDIIKDEERIEIRVAPQISEKIKEKIEKIKQDMNICGNFVVISDKNIKINDCKISFNSGSIEKNTTEVFDKIDEIINNYRTAVLSNTLK